MGENCSICSVFKLLWCFIITHSTVQKIKEKEEEKYNSKLSFQMDTINWRKKLIFNSEHYVEILEQQKLSKEFVRIVAS